MEDIREYIIEAGRPIKKRYSKRERRIKHMKYRREKYRIRRKQKLRKLTGAYKMWKRKHDIKKKRTSYRPIKRIYV
jgi:hypothetical protein